MTGVGFFAGLGLPSSRLAIATHPAMLNDVQAFLARITDPHASESQGKPDLDALLATAQRNGVIGVQMALNNFLSLTRSHVIPTRRFFKSVVPKRAQVAVAYMVVGPQDLMATGLPPDTVGAVGTMEWAPDLQSLKPLPYHPKNLWVAADLHTPTGEPWNLCPRSFLKRQLRNFKAKTGLDVVVGPEIEFHAFEKYGEDGVPDKCGFTVERNTLDTLAEFFYLLRLVMPTHSPTCSVVVTVHSSNPAWSTHQCAEILGLLGKAGDLMDTMVETLDQAGIEVNTWHCEGGNIQWEFSLGPRDALTTADDIVYTRTAVKAVARQFGLTATMAPKPLGATEIGNGGHLHFSLRNAAGENVFIDESDPAGISKIGRHFMAGILKHLVGISLVLLPTEMSYERAVPHFWAGVFTAWGRENKEAALRVCCPNSNANNVELKIADSTANPYLAIGTIIAAGLDGIENQLELGPEATEDPGLLPADFKKEHGIRQMPTTLEAALKEFANEPLIKEAWGEEMADKYSRTIKFVADYVSKMPKADRYKLYCEKY
ncbi:glutamine synthetase/guanido kinase [Gonapodya prolifera JEL478]|uniref:Glutamine synthetase/guanido kinase n=1 Tax=Gonapodya prolifera (strain JEL478) TaxID=1344416 RepID=A0A139AT75_GONPJ|nr:glutamine synthetase/guanido kinase [Gonapodya prolifera JEL478]|eukprot:KXS19937.1 glutamine synthetase/guanido kinase [Gonapodya prolifera JEL478]